MKAKVELLRNEKEKWMWRVWATQRRKKMWISIYFGLPSNTLLVFACADIRFFSLAVTKRNQKGNIRNSHMKNVIYVYQWIHINNIYFDWIRFEMAAKRIVYNCIYSHILPIYHPFGNRRRRIRKRTHRLTNLYSFVVSIFCFSSSYFGFVFFVFFFQSSVYILCVRHWIDLPSQQCSSPSLLSLSWGKQKCTTIAFSFQTLHTFFFFFWFFFIATNCSHKKQAMRFGSPTAMITTTDANTGVESPSCLRSICFE